MSKLTEKALAQAAMNLLKSRPLDKITIKDITESCGLTRNTFYYHFHDVYELLRWIFEQKTDAIMAKYRDEEDWEGGLAETLDYLYKNQQMITHIHESISDDLLLRFINEVLMRHARVIVERQAKGQQCSEEAIRIATELYLGAAVSNVMSWIQGGMQQTPEYLAQVYNTLFLGTIHAVLESAEQAAALK